MTPERTAYWKLLCRLVAEWVAKRDDIESFEVAKNHPENPTLEEHVKVRFNTPTGVKYAAGCFKYTELMVDEEYMAGSIGCCLNRFNVALNHRNTESAK